MLTNDVTNLESRLFDGELPEIFSDVKDETSDVVLWEMGRAAVERDEPVHQIVLELPTAEVRQELKRRRLYWIH